MGLSLSIYIKGSDPSEDSSSIAERAALASGVTFTPWPNRPGKHEHTGEFRAVLGPNTAPWDADFGSFPVWLNIYGNAHRVRVGAGIKVGRSLRKAGFDVVVDDEYFGIIDPDAVLSTVIARAEAEVA